MKTKSIAFIGAVIMALLSGCASKPITLSPVGPEPVRPASIVPTGYLKVFSDTETHEIAENLCYYPHTGYSIYDTSANRVKYVPNHVGSTDESPTLVVIPTGDYKVVAESSAYGRVIVPVVIEAGRTTVVHLDRGWNLAPDSGSSEFVRLPDGEAVGWKNFTVK